MEQSQPVQYLGVFLEMATESGRRTQRCSSVRPQVSCFFSFLCIKAAGIAWEGTPIQHTW